MTSRPLKRLDRPSKRKYRKRGPSISSLIFRLVVLFNIVYAVYQFVPSHKNASPNISQSTESAVSEAVNDKIRSNEGDNTNNKICSKAIGKYQTNNTEKFNGSLVNESEVNYFENERTEKPKTIFVKAGKKKTTKKIIDDEKRHFNDLLMRGIFKAKLRYGFRKMNRRMSSKKNSKKKIIDHLLFEKNEIFTFFLEEKKRYVKYLSVMCRQGKQRKWAKNSVKNLGFVKDAKNCEEFKMEPISVEKDDIKNKQGENSAIDTILFFGCGLTFLVILALNILYFLLQAFKTNNSKYLLQNTMYRSRSSKTLLMALGLLLSYAPVSSDVTLSTQGTYFQNEAPGRYLKGYVNESSVVPSLSHCQMRCDTLHTTCKSLNYVENEDGSNICKINHDAQYCALPADFIVKENSFYVETMPGKDDVELCSTCGYKGVIKKTKETPGFMCLCQGRFYGDRCQNEGKNTCVGGNPCHSNATCNNTLGSFLCTCKKGFTGDGRDCTDVDECFNNPCHSNATCNNTLGSFLCTCEKGFTGDGRNCTVIIDDLNSSPTLNGKADYIRQLRSWLPGSNKWRLCWRASQHGWAATTFHSQCDNKGPTVTIICVGEYVFGGYADVSWKGTRGYVSSENAFLFSLKNKDDLKPFKAPVYRYSNKAFNHHSDYGPTFGYGWDLHISNNANLNTGSHTSFGFTYELPPGYTPIAANTKALLAGTHRFTPSEIEVFYLQ